MESERRVSALKGFYEKKHKLLLVLPIAVLLLAIVQIAVQTATTGDFINKDVSLKGGMTVTIPIEKQVNLDTLEMFFKDNYPDIDVSVRSLSSGTETKGVIVSADIDVEDKERSDSFISDLEELTGIDRDDFSIEFMGSSLGSSFFRETFKAVIMAFILMGAIVFLYFGESWMIRSIVVALALITVFIVKSADSVFMYIISAVFGAALLAIYLKYSIPSFAVMLAAFSDIIITLAIVNLIGIKVSTAGLAAFLMLIGYSVDTDILVSTKLLKRKEGTVMERLYGAMKTGLAMSFTTIVALIVAIMFSQSEVISQIMTIVLIGLVIDLMNTWIQNVSILRMYLERRK